MNRPVAVFVLPLSFLGPHVPVVVCRSFVTFYSACLLVFRPQSQKLAAALAILSLDSAKQSFAAHSSNNCGLRVSQPASLLQSSTGSTNKPTLSQTQRKMQVAWIFAALAIAQSVVASPTPIEPLLEADTIPNHIPQGACMRGCRRSNSWRIFGVRSRCKKQCAR